MTERFFRSGFRPGQHQALSKGTGSERKTKIGLNQHPDLNTILEINYEDATETRTPDRILSPEAAILCPLALHGPLINLAGGGKRICLD